MEAQATAEVLRHLFEISDPRRHNHLHKLSDIITIAVFAVICGAESWVDVAEYGRRKQDWLGSFLELPNGIPSHDTFGRVFARLKPEEFERCFMAWMSSLVELGGGKLLAIDGKSLRRSFEHSWDKSGMAHMVSAFVQANHMVFAQIKTEGKGQELDAIQKLLKLLELEGSVVTIDALGCNKTVVELILEGKGNYLLQVKDNQPTLHGKLRRLMDGLILDKFAGVEHDYYQQTDGDHGRIETRRVWVCWDIKDLGPVAEEWPGLRSLVVVESVRETPGHASSERHYYISSLDRRSKAKRMAGYVRGHWSVENNLHWQLDISFNEDQRRIRTGHGAENFSRLCRIALNLLKNETSLKIGVAGKRKSCGWDNQYLLKVVGQ
jgi:predicted transposase YbfD/YdcC